MLNQKRFGLQILCFQDTDYLDVIINTWLPFVDKIVISIGEKSWQGNIQNNGIAEKIVKKYLNNEKVFLHKGNWKTEAEQRNENLKMQKECDWVFIVDADELWCSEDIHKMQDFALKHDIIVIKSHWTTRFKNPDWAVEPKEPFTPVIMVNNKKNPEFLNARDIKPTYTTSQGLVPMDYINIEHMSYVRGNDKLIKEKIQTFSHAEEILNGVDWWFENIFLQVDLDSKFIHPTNPESYNHLIKKPLHPETEKFLKEFSPKIYAKLDKPNKPEKIEYL